MTLVETQNAGNSFVIVRGISQARNSEPSVAVLVDGVLETNPAEFNQELFDIKQIEVLKGPQGALYGRNAIGGAIIIRTQDPADEFAGTVQARLRQRQSAKRAQRGVSGPIERLEDAEVSRVAELLQHRRLPRERLPRREGRSGSRTTPAALRLIWKPNDSFTGDLRLSADRLETRALYFVIPRGDETNPFTSFSTPPNANDVTTPITVNNPGEDNRDLYDASLKLDFNAGAGTLTSISAYDKTKEILTGDAYDFRPIRAMPCFTALFGTDLNQSQFLDVKAYSEELRFTSPDGRALLAGSPAPTSSTPTASSPRATCSTLGNGVLPVYRTPSADPLIRPIERRQHHLPRGHAEQQRLGGVRRLRPSRSRTSSSSTRRCATTRTRARTRPTRRPHSCAVQDPSAYTGQVRKHTWSELQPKVTLRYKPTTNVTFYGGWSRGFRSGGFNQTGVGAVARASGIARRQRPVQCRGRGHLGGGRQGRSSSTGG